MNPLFEAAAEFAAFVEDRAWRYCIIGGLAVIRWGQPRATNDVDISLLAGLGYETDFIDPLLGAFSARMSDARPFAMQSRLLPLSASNGVALDVALAAFPFEEEIIDRATPFEFAPGLLLVTISAEDLVVMKALAGRLRDWADIEEIAVRQTGVLDWGFVLRSLESLRDVATEYDVVEKVADLKQSVEND